MPEQEDERYVWRDTYFIWFLSAERPTLDAVKAAVAKLPGRYDFRNAELDAQGKLESVLVVSPEDHAALEISYGAGEDLREEGARVAQEITAGEGGEPAKLSLLARCDARFDVLHFEHAQEDSEDDDEIDEMFDPSTLLIVLDALVDLTRGVGFDPQTGVLL